MSHLTMNSIEQAHDQFIDDMNGPHPAQRCYGRMMRDIMPVLARELDRAKEEGPESVGALIEATAAAVAMQMATVICSTFNPINQAELAERMLAVVQQEVTTHTQEEAGEDDAMTNDNRAPNLPRFASCAEARDAIRAEIAGKRDGDFAIYPRPEAEAAFRPLADDELATAVRFAFDGPDGAPVRVLLMYLLEDDEVLVLRSDAEDAA